MKIFLVGDFTPHGLAWAYKAAFTDEGHDVACFDMNPGIDKYTRLGKWGKVFNTFVPVRAWIQKANRDMVIQVKNYRPDIFISFTNCEVLPASLAFIKSILPVKTILVWPDTLFNLKEFVLQSAPLYDLVASYSDVSSKVFTQYGFRSCAWVPLAADMHSHYAPVNQSAKVYDITFVGGWRPEREEVMHKVIKHFPTLHIKIYGPSWNKSSSAEVKRCITNQPLYGKDFTQMVQQTLINMNIIDDTNFPAANMRFFETPISGGLQLASSCPEMEGIYKNRENVLYFRSDDELLEQIEFVKSNPKEAQQITEAAQQFTLNAHTYNHRVTQIIKAVS